MIRRSVFAAALVIAFACCPLHATRYTVESNHTMGTVRWNHLGFANPSAQFNHVEGTLEFDPADPGKASVMVSLPLASLSTGVPDLDDDFHSAAFFDIARYPTATFKSTRVETTDMPGHLKVTGDLSLRGVTHPVTLDVTLNKIGTNPRMHMPAVGFEATGTLKRSDFGLGKFVPQVSDELTLQITCEAEEATAYAAYLKSQDDEAAAAAKAAKK